MEARDQRYKNDTPIDIVRTYGVEIASANGLALRLELDSRDQKG
jgi:hypothetical protein